MILLVAVDLELGSGATSISRQGQLVAFVREYWFHMPYTYSCGRTASRGSHSGQLSRRVLIFEIMDVFHSKSSSDALEVANFLAVFMKIMETSN